MSKITQLTGNRLVGAHHVTMVLCVVVGCNNHSDSEADKRISFYRIPAVTDRKGIADYQLRKLRRGYLAAIIRKNLDLEQLDNYGICERYFISGSPVKLYDRTNPDWLLTSNLGHEASESSSNTENRVARHKRAQE